MKVEKKNTILVGWMFICALFHHCNMLLQLCTVQWNPCRKLSCKNIHIQLIMIYSWHESDSVVFFMSDMLGLCLHTCQLCTLSICDYCFTTSNLNNKKKTLTVAIAKFRWIVNNKYMNWWNTNYCVLDKRNNGMFISIYDCSWARTKSIDLHIWPFWP